MFDQFLQNDNINRIFFLFLIISTTISKEQNLNVSLSLQLNSTTNSLDSLLQNDDLRANLDLACVKMFSPIISNLSPNCQSQLISVFTSNLRPGRCCLPDVFIKTMKTCMNKNINTFTNIMTKISGSNKKAYSCYKNNEILNSLNKVHLYNIERESDDKFIREILVNHNKLSHLMSKCIAKINGISMELLSRMCLPIESLPKFFTRDSNGNYNSIVKRKQDDIEIFKACSGYLRSHSLFTNTNLNSYIDQVNFLLGIDECNYHSDFFNFDIDKDRNDVFFPISYVPNKNPDSLNSLVSIWSTCASSNSFFPSLTVEKLKLRVGTSIKINPNGLSNSLGRSEINFDIIRRNFPLEKYPEFHIKCTSIECQAHCSGCNILTWDSKNVILSSNVEDFQVSCCKEVCIVYVELKNPSTSGTEVFRITGSPLKREVDKLLTEKLKNAGFCFDYGRNKYNWTNLDIPFKKPYLNSSSNFSSINNKTEFININFTDGKLRSIMTDIQTYPQNYNIDFNIGLALNLLLKPYDNTTTISLMDFLTKDLYNRNNSFYFFCESGKCNYQCKNCNDNNKSFLIYPNNTLTVKTSTYTRKSNLQGSRLSTSTNTLKSNSSFIQFDNRKSSLNPSSSLATSRESSILANDSPLSRGSLLFTSISSNTNKLNTRKISSDNPSYSVSNITSQSPSLKHRNKNDVLPSNSINSPSLHINIPSSKNDISEKTLNDYAFTISKKTINSNYLNSYSYSFTSRDNSSVPHKFYTTDYRPKNRISSRYHSYKPAYYEYYDSNKYYLPSWGFYSHYYLPNQNFYIYRSRINGNSSSNKQSQTNESDQSVKNNPNDWMPFYRAPIDISEYMSVINRKIDSIKIYVECCIVFCVTYIESFDNQENLKSNSKKNIFIDINLRNRVNFDSNQITPSTKKCLLDNLYTKLKNATIPNTPKEQMNSLDAVIKCGLDTPFLTFPLKNSCRNQINKHCSLNDYDVLIDRFFPKNYTGKCKESLLCSNVTNSSSLDEQAACGAKISTNLMIKEYRVSYTNIAYPCRDEDIASTIRPTTLIETHMLKNKLIQLKNDRLQYLNESILTTREREELKSIFTISNESGNLTVVIDQNNNKEANMNVEPDLLKINSEIPSEKSISSGTIYGLNTILFIFLTFL